MLSRKDISSVLSSYDSNRLTVSVLGSHSALEVCRGAREEGMRNLAVCQKGRDSTYSRYYLSRTVKSTGRKAGVIDEIILVDKFADVASEKVRSQLKKKNAVFVPNRSFSVYVPYDDIENNFDVPLFGNRALLKAEERWEKKNQYWLMHKAGLQMPRKFKSSADIDRLALVKASEAKRSYERAFFFASSPEDYEKRAGVLLREGKVTEEGLKSAVIEEFVVGAQFNFNFFYSPLSQEIELMGTDTRRQTNLDGLLRLPAAQQAEVLKHISPTYIEVGHIASTVRESLLQTAFESAEKLVEAAKKEFAPGIIGPFALQCALISEEGKEKLVTFDLSLRIPGSPGITATPYSACTHGEPVSVGRRIAMEIKDAARLNRLQEVVT
jgi:5-formaminoimidazole-4-carboxamide-1-(beta)-D-ribofuranosyl 5'-monophosphate synthetase